MDEPEKVVITWNEFQENITTSFGMPRADKDFLDITLVSDDGQSVHAYKVINRPGVAGAVLQTPSSLIH